MKICVGDQLAGLKLIVLLAVLTGCTAPIMTIEQLSNLTPPVTVQAISREGDVLLVDKANTFIIIRSKDSTAKAIDGTYRAGDVLIKERK